MNKRVLFLLFCFVCMSVNSIFGQDPLPIHLADPSKLRPDIVAPPDIVNMNRVVDSLMNKMTLKEKIAQLYVLSTSSRQSDKNKKKMERYIKREGIGGIIIMYDDLEPSVEYINRLKSLSKYPMIFSIDAEWGLAMRYNEVITFPRQGQLGALPCDSLIYEMGLAIGKQALRMGMEINFAPSVDVNNNLNNPVIHTRSFGSDKELVAEYAIAYMKGMQDAGILTSAKHFPGHGDTDSDSHHRLPVISHDRERLNEIELYPFRRLIEEGVDMVMVGHLDIPTLDPSGRPSSISKRIITDLLREEMGYEGIIVTDALNMKGVTSGFDLERIPLEAFTAGVDMILMPDDVSKSIRLIRKAIRRGEIPISRLDESCRRILEAKYKVGLLPDNRHYIDPENLLEDMNSAENIEIMEKIAEESITLIHSRDEFNPSSDLDKTIAYIGLGLESFPEEAGFDFYTLDKDADQKAINDLFLKLSDFDTILFGIHNTNQAPARQFGVIDKQMKAFSEIFQKNRESETPKTMIMAYFGSPYALKQIEIEQYDIFLLGYAPTDYNLKAVLKIIRGEIPVKGKLSIEL